MILSRIAVLAIVLGAAAPVAAQTVLTGDHSVAGSLCVGADCTGSETFSSDLKIKSASPSLFFEDMTHPFRARWSILTNVSAINRDFTLMSDIEGYLSKPLVIDAAANDNSIYVGQNGLIGFGTMMPQSELHIKTLNSPSITLEETNYAGQEWRLIGETSVFQIRDGTMNTTPFIIKGPDVTGGNFNAFVIDEDGNIGMGTQFPQHHLHLVGNDGAVRAVVQENSATTTARTLLNLTNNGRPEMVMANTDTNGEWAFGAGTNFFLKRGAIGSPSHAKLTVLTVMRNGDAVLRGTLTTGGTTCGGGCDRVFTERAVIAGEDYASRMWAQGYLPHVGPTEEGAPLNVSEKLGGMLNALEHAHVFIAEQRDEIAGQKAEIAELKADKAEMSARLARLEALMAGAGAAD